MYVPASFRVTDRGQLLDFMRANSFATLVSRVGGEPFASHLPLLIDPSAGPHGTLVGHMARANPQWRSDDDVFLTIFSGPHAYVSPTWYAAENTVPTWNYVAVHAYGRFELIDDRDALEQIVRDYVAFYEAPMPQPWQVTSPAEFLDKLLAAIVGFRIEITRLEGKWKLNQNHPEERRERVVRALTERGDENSLEIARLMSNDEVRMTKE